MVALSSQLDSPSQTAPGPGEASATLEGMMRGAAEDSDSDFEHRRIFANLNQRLFGRGPDPSIGRFRVDRRLGAGGMGEVYLCTDAELDRRVAIKRVLGSGDAREQARLRREAQDLALFSHPNVVQVHEIGEHEGRTFLAMEYVDGQTLGRWLDDGPRPWREILDVFVGAGRGLAAAHAAGVVHRDFKPDNVLIGQDGRPRVADFGLARRSRGPALPPSPADPADPASPSPSPSPSHLGVGGTIPYMPLEQLRGEATDARADQFAFCVALYEALWEGSPFPRHDVAARVAAMDRGVPTPPPASDLPRGLWRVLRRGLARAPESRWSGMDPLLEALERAARRRRRAAAVTALAGALAASVALGAFAFETPSPTAKARCAELDRARARALDQSLGPERIAALGERVATFEGAHVPESWARLRAQLEAWRGAWLEAHRELCVQREGLGVESRAHRATQTCLDRQRRQTEGLFAGLETSAGGPLAALVGDHLPDPSSCARPPAASPPTAAQREGVEAGRARLDAAIVARRLGDYPGAQAMASQALEEADAAAYGPLRAEALLEQARVADAMELDDWAAQRYAAAGDEAERHHLDELAALAWLERAKLDLYDHGGGPKAPAPALALALALAQGEEHLRRAAVDLERAGSLEDRHRARLRFLQGRAAERRGHFDQAREHYTEALALDPSPGYAAALAHTLEVQSESATDDGRLAREALGLRRQALDLARERYGPQHPNTAMQLYNLGRAGQRAHTPGHALEFGEEQSLALLEGAAAIWASDPQAPAWRHLEVRRLLAERALREGARADLERHAEAIAPLDPPESQAIAEQLLATFAASEARPSDALRHARRARALFLELPDPSDPSGPSGPSDLALGGLIVDQLLALGEDKEARRALRELLASPGAAAPTARFELLLQRTELELLDGELSTAAATLDNARAALAQRPMGSKILTFAVLRALVDLRRGELESRTLAALREAKEHTQLAPTALEAWLTALEVSASERSSLGL